jgi:hypothetical protein
MHKDIWKKIRASRKCGMQLASTIRMLCRSRNPD